MISSKWLVLAATLIIVPPVVQAQTATTPPALVTEPHPVVQRSARGGNGGHRAMPQGWL
jgi:hypothetical protein